MKHFFKTVFIVYLWCLWSAVGSIASANPAVVDVDVADSAQTKAAPTATSVTVFVQEALDSKGRPLPLSPSLVKFFQFFERHTDIRLQAVIVPWNRAKQLSLEGKGLIWGFSKSPERLIGYRFSETVLESRIWAVAYGEPRFPLRNIDDLKNKTISVERGVSHGMEFELAKNKIFKVDEDPARASSRFRKLIAKRSDVLLWGLVQFDRQDLFLDYLHKTYLPNLRDPELLGKRFYASQRPMFYDSIHFACAKGQFEQAMTKIDAAIRYGFKTGELTKLVSELD